MRDLTSRALLGAAMALVGCRSELVLGHDPAGCPLTEDPQCLPQVEVASDFVEVSSRATAQLTASWTVPLASSTPPYTASALDLGIWILASDTPGLRAQHVRPDGTLEAPSFLGPPAGVLAGVPVVASIDAVASDARGPLVVLHWNQFADATCMQPNDHLDAPSAGCLIGYQLIALDETTPEQSQRFTLDLTWQSTQHITRSADGHVFVGAGPNGTIALSDRGAVNWTRTSTTGAVFVDPLALVALGGAGYRSIETIQVVGNGNARPFTTTFYDGQGRASTRWLSNADSTRSSGAVVLAGDQPDAYTLVYPRTGLPGESGDLSVARYVGDSAQSERVIVREDYANLALWGVAQDPAQSVFVGTASGTRQVGSGTLPGTITWVPLLCKLPLDGDAHCAALPKMSGLAQPMQAGPVDSVYVLTSADEPNSYELSRFDVP